MHNYCVFLHIYYFDNNAQSHQLCSLFFFQLFLRLFLQFFQNLHNNLEQTILCSFQYIIIIFQSLDEFWQNSRHKLGTA